MKVFTEWHHGGLFQAQVRWWEKRFNGMVFRPIGLDWAEQGYWAYSKNPDTIKQYLDPVSVKLGPEGYFYYYDNSERATQRCITLDQFKKTKFDLIVASLQEHVAVYKRLRDEYQPQAKLIRVIGNSGELEDWETIKNVIDTTKLYSPPESVNYLNINQEFDLQYFCPEEPKVFNKISNFMNCLPDSPQVSIFRELKARMPDFEFKMFGINGDDGFIQDIQKLGEEMRKSSFIFHVKSHGEGFGHVIHNAYAVGRPVITIKRYYQGKMAERFLTDGYSCIDIDDLSPEKAIEKIRYYSRPNQLLSMSQNARALFNKYVDFEKDSERLKEFLKNLK